MEIEEVARKYALRNAVEHGGECNPGAVIGKIFAEEEFENKGEVQQKAQQVCQEVNELSLEEQEDELESYEFKEQEEEEHDPVPDLEGAEDGEVVLRFAPNPNAPPHIGHARGMVINGELKEKYDGKLILRFDDTDPQTKRPLKTEEYDAYQMQQEDFEWLGYEIDEVRKCSENFDTYIEYAEELIEMGKAYVCQCSQEEGQKYRKEGESCPHRDQSAEENMDLWEEMRNGGLGEGDAVLKIKTDMQHKNPAIRDFVAFRIIEDADHPVTGDEYRVWPMLDFQGAIEDHEMGTTHIFRGKELRASAERQKFIYEYFGWEYPRVNHWGQVQISGFDAPVSGSKLGEMVENGGLDGWDDPRAPTLRALRRRGFQPEAIRNFFVDMGVTENDVEASVESLEKENTRVIDASTERRFLVRDPVELEVEGIPEDVEVGIPRHPEEEMGERTFELERENGKITVLVEEDDLEDGFIRLKGLCNIRVEDGKGEFVEGDHKVALEKDGDIIHWAPENADTSEVYMPDGSVIEGRIEPSNYKVDELYQFERFGFVRCDEENVFYYGHQ
ncbi:glutamate--tRNA ligase [Candidatus Nanohalobium constans]|uniref:Glutamate--tRNA ligase n=1 Tax=Candidatus Nanohalobium constans TaxID=2565781 RepID=A0A5Q0UF64_9ARCH|nr:glutamate--tRNA ligase [Candidatus Nanohalobium constans]QGA80243.1 glutamyl-tRNA synthetase [Candidatus Nanohalobium constans]